MESNLGAATWGCRLTQEVWGLGFRPKVSKHLHESVVGVSNL